MIDNNLVNILLTRKVFLPIIFYLTQIFAGIKQLRMKAEFKLLAEEFKKESYKFILNNCFRFSEMTLYPPIGEFNDSEFNHKFLTMVFPLHA